MAKRLVTLGANIHMGDNVSKHLIHSDALYIGQMHYNILLCLWGQLSIHIVQYSTNFRSFYHPIMISDLDRDLTPASFLY